MVFLKEVLQLSEEVHFHGYWFIYWLQNSYGHYENVFLTLSHLGSPRMAFILYFPLLFYLFDVTNAKKLLWSAVLAEWGNLVLKWSLFGDRPYWWPQNNNISHVPTIKQYYLTCETGPGMPSGHAMVSAATWYFILVSVIKSILCRGVVGRLLAWLTYIILLVCMCVARTFTATHFPHQVVLGVATGVMLSLVIERVCGDIERYGWRQYGGLTLWLVSSTGALYWLLQHILLWDPNWSLQLARRHCADPNHIHLITTPASAFCRDVASVVGLGLAQATSIAQYAATITFTSHTVAKVANFSMFLVSCVFVTTLDYYMWTGYTDIQFYMLILIKCLVRVYVIVAVIPYSIRIMFATIFTYKCDPRLDKVKRN